MRQALELLDAALDGVEEASTQKLREALGLAKRLRSRVELYETKAASVVARRERHGDGGAGLLNQVSGRSRSEAVRNVRAEAEIEQMPAARAGVSDGEISLANAASLTKAARKTSADAVDGDADLVEMAKTLPEDEFAQVAQRWTIQHQDADDLSARHRRNRRNRHVRFWNGDDGAVHMRGSFDAEMGARIQQRLQREAEGLRQTDRRRVREGQVPRDSGIENGAANTETGVAGEARTRDQRMADALGTLVAGGADGSRLAGGSQDGGVHLAAGETDDAGILRPAGGSQDGGVASEAGRRPAATEIIVRADLEALLGQPGGYAEILGSGPIPPSALQRLCCNADLSVVLFADKLTPLYETTPSRAPSAAQRRALIARDGACIGCGAAPHQCEAHHIVPWACRGKTRIDNLVLVCWHCHDLIHDHNWKVARSGDRYRLHPPNLGCSDEYAATGKSARRSAGPDSAADPHSAQAAILTGLTHHQPMLC